MERLLHSSASSSSLVSLKSQSKSSALFTRLARLDPPSLCFAPPRRRPDSHRINSISCKHHQNPSPYSSSPSVQPSDSLCGSASSSSQFNSADGSKSDSGFLERIVRVAYEQRKTISTGTLILISTVTAFLLNSIIARPAFASFQTAAKSSGAVVGGKLIRTELLSSAWTGFFAGCLHTLSGPDHLAALAPLSIGRTRMESAAVGALWGCGHDAGQVIFGLIFLLLKDRLHIEIIRTWGTRVVGLTLLVIGAMGIKEASEVPAPCVAVEGCEADINSLQTEKPSNPKKKIGFATFATGIVHGLQPDALMMVLPALALPSRLAGAAFLIMFLAGTVVAMGSYTVFIGSCSQALKEKVPRITEKLTWASSLVAIGLGVAIIVSQFFGFSLY